MVARGLLVAAVAVAGLAQTGDKVFTVTHHEGAGKSNVVKARVKQQEKANDRTLSPRSAEPRVVVASIKAPGVAVALQSESDLPKLARPRMLNGYAQVAALSALALADYHSTQRAFRNVPYGREANPILSCGGQLCGGRYWALNGAVIGASYAVNRFVAPKLPARSRHILSAATWAMIGVRGYVVAHNYRAGSR